MINLSGNVESTDVVSQVEWGRGWAKGMRKLQGTNLEAWKAENFKLCWCLRLD